MAFLMMFQIPVIFDLKDIRCTTWVYLMVVFVLTAVNIVMLRVLLLYAAFVITEKSIQFDKNVRQGKDGFDVCVWTKNLAFKEKCAMLLERFDRFLFFKRRWFDAGRPLKVMLVVIFIELMPMTGYAIRYTELTEVTIIDANCRFRFIERASTLFTVLLVLYVIILAACAWRLKKLRENFHIVEEFKGILVGCVLGIILVVINRIPQVGDVVYDEEFPVALLYLTGAPALVFWWACLERINLIATKTRDEIELDTRSRDTSSAGSSLAKSFSTVTRTADGRERSFSGKHSHKAVLYRFVQDPERFELFRLFLVKEFSIENLLYWTDCNHLMNLDDSDPSIASQISQIYKTYIHFEAPLMVNISSKCRRALDKKLAVLEMGKSLEIVTTIELVEDDIVQDIPGRDSAPVSPSMSEFVVPPPTDYETLKKAKNDVRPKFVFYDSADEIFHLMATDPFRRFCRTEECQNWLSQHPDEMQELKNL
jgi:hypothetical protein